MPKSTKIPKKGTLKKSKVLPKKTGSNKKITKEKWDLILAEQKNKFLAAVNKKMPGANVQVVILRRKNPVHEHILKFNKTLQAVPGMKDHEFYAFDSPGNNVCPVGQVYCYSNGIWGCNDPEECTP